MSRQAFGPPTPGTQDSGIIDLLRRRRKLILATDTGDDPAVQLLDLRNAMQIAIDQRLCTFFDPQVAPRFPQSTRNEVHNDNEASGRRRCAIIWVLCDSGFIQCASEIIFFHWSLVFTKCQEMLLPWWEYPSEACLGFVLGLCISKVVVSAARDPFAGIKIFLECWEQVSFSRSLLGGAAD